MNKKEVQGVDEDTLASRVSVRITMNRKIIDTAGDRVCSTKAILNPLRASSPTWLVSQSMRRRHRWHSTKIRIAIHDKLGAREY